MIFLNKIEHHEYSKATWQKIHIYLKSGQVGPNGDKNNLLPLFFSKTDH